MSSSLVHLASLALAALLLWLPYAHGQQTNTHTVADEYTQGTHWTAYVFRQTKTKGISNLSFPVKKVPVLLVPSETKLRPLVNLQMIYDRPGWSLAGPNHELLKPVGKNDYRVLLYLGSRISKITLSASGPSGETEEETIYVYAPDAREIGVKSNWNRITLGAGPSYFSYFQSGYGSFDAACALLSAEYSTEPNRASPWGFFGGAHMTVLNFIENPEIGANPNLIEAKLDASYRVTPNEPRRWNVRILGGVSYLTMISNGSPFGFSNLISPDLGVQSRYTLSPTRAVIGSFRLVPINATSLLQDHGIDLTLELSHILPSFHRIEWGLAYFSYGYHPDSNTRIMTNLLSFRVTYSL